MRPVPLPPGWTEKFMPGEVVRVVTMGAPDGDLTNPDVAPVEAIRRASTMPSGAVVPCISVLWVLEEGDLQMLRELPNEEVAIMFTSWGGLPPHDLQVVPR